MPYPVSSSLADLPFTPISLGFSEFHFLVLNNEKLQVISSLNGDAVEEETMSIGDGVPLGIIGDPTRVNNLMFTTNSIFQVLILLIPYLNCPDICL